jgi:hypothetical protein
VEDVVGRSEVRRRDRSGATHQGELQAAKIGKMGGKRGGARAGGERARGAGKSEDGGLR